MAALAPFADAVEFLYTDISPALVGYGRKTYGKTYPFAHFQLLDVDCDVESQGCAAGSYDIVFATNVLHATANMGRTLSNCKVMLRKGEDVSVHCRGHSHALNLRLSREVFVVESSLANQQTICRWRLMDCCGHTQEAW